MANSIIQDSQEDGTPGGTKEFLELLYTGCPDDAKAIISYSHGKGFSSMEFRLDEEQAIDSIVRRFAGKQGLPHVYARPTVLRQSTILSQGQRGKRTDAYGTHVLWTEIDPDGKDDFDKRTLDAIRSFHIPPTLVAHSGRGYHVYWRLDAFTEDWEWAEQANKWLGSQLGGDHVFDAARVMRMPGTWNNKEDAQCFSHIIESHPERVYKRDDFGLADLDSKEQAVFEEMYETEDLPLGFEGQVKASSQRLWDRIYSEATAEMAGAPTTNKNGVSRVDRSRNDSSIAVQLLRLGLTKGQVFSVLSHPTWFSGSKFREKFNETYVRLTIAKAASFAGEVELSKAPEIAKRLEERYVMMYHQLTWWVYDPKKGTFVAGRNELAIAIQALSGNRWTKTLQDNVFNYLKERHVKDDLVSFPELINVSNGMLRWKSRGGERELQPHSPGYESIYQIRANWVPNADCSEIDEAVSRIFTPEAARVWWMFSGFSLFTGDNKSIRCLFAIVGPRRTGKTTMLLCLKEFLGRANVSEVSLSELTGEGNQFTTSRMIGKMLNLDVDSPYEVPAKKLSLLKKLAERQSIPIERKFEGAEDTDLIIKLAFAMNDFPRFGISDEAVYDRWIVLQPREDAKPMYPGRNGGIANLHKVLMASDKNRSAWLLRSVEGLQELMALGSFPDTETVVQGRNRMRHESDSIYRFWMDHTEEDPDAVATMREIHSTYAYFVAEEKSRAAGATTFTRRTQELVRDGLIPGLRVYTQRDAGYGQATAVGRRKKGTVLEPVLPGSFRGG